MKITINTQPKADEDIFKAGTLVKHYECGWLILITDSDSLNDDRFTERNPVGWHVFDSVSGEMVEGVG